MFEIEKNVPIPDHAYEGKYNSRYPFPRLEVRDSFVVRGDKKEQLRALQAFYTMRKRYNDKTFLYAREKDGIRFWRVA